MARGDPEVARAWVTIIPSLDGAQGTITKELTEEVGGAADKAGKSSGRTLGTSIAGGMRTAAAGVAAAATGIVAGVAAIGAITSAAEPAIQSMASLDTAFGAVGMTSEQARSTYEGFMGLVGDSERATEAAQDMANLADAGGDIDAWYGIAAGTVARFGDALPLENLIESANETARTGTVVGGLADALNWAGLTAEQYSEALSGNGAAQAAFNEALSAGLPVEDAMNAALATTSDTTERQAILQSTLNSIYGETGRAYAENNAALIENREAQARFNASLAELGEALLPVMTTLTDLAASALPALTPVAEGIAGLFSRAVPAIRQAGEEIAEGLDLSGVASSLTGEVMPAISSLWGSVSSAASGVVGVVAPAVSQLVGLVVGQLPAVASVVSQVVGAVSSVISTALPAIAAVWNATWPYLSTTVSTVFGLIQSVVSAVMPVVQAVISTVSAAISGDWSGAWQGIQSVFSAVWDAIQSVVSSALGAIQSVISGALSFVQGLWEGAWGAVGDFLNEAWNGFVETVSGGNDAVVGLLSDLPGNIIGIFAGAGSWLIDAGASILGGLLDGLRSAWGAVTDFVGGIGDWIVSHKGPPSYDRVMLEENGELIIGGLGRGMEAEFESVKGRVAAMNAEISGGFAASRASSATVSQPVAGPTYVVNVDGDALGVDSRVRRALEEFVSEVERSRRLGSGRVAYGV